MDEINEQRNNLRVHRLNLEAKKMGCTIKDYELYKSYKLDEVITAFFLGGLLVFLFYLIGYMTGVGVNL
jgi:hypothetical protein